MFNFYNTIFFLCSSTIKLEPFISVELNGIIPSYRKKKKPDKSGFINFVLGIVPSMAAKKTAIQNLAVSLVFYFHIHFSGLRFY